MRKVSFANSGCAHFRLGWFSDPLPLYLFFSIVFGCLLSVSRPWTRSGRSNSSHQCGLLHTTQEGTKSVCKQEDLSLSTAANIAFSIRSYRSQHVQIGTWSPEIRAFSLDWSAWSAVAPRGMLCDAISFPLFCRAGYRVDTQDHLVNWYSGEAARFCCSMLTA